MGNAGDCYGEVGTCTRYTPTATDSAAAKVMVYKKVD